MAREQTEYDEAQAALEREAGVLVIDVKKAELLAQKVLATHSVRMKTLFSELVVQTAEELGSGDVKPKDRAVALGALRGVCDRLYGWDSEPNIAEMERARSGAINLELIRKSPEELERMLERPKPLEAEFNDVEKEAPLSAAQQASQPRREASFQRAEKATRGTTPCPTPSNTDQKPPQSAPSAEQAIVQVGSLPLSPQQRRQRELEELARLRAEWRGWR